MVVCLKARFAAVALGVTFVLLLMAGMLGVGAGEASSVRLPSRGPEAGPGIVVIVRFAEGQGGKALVTLTPSADPQRYEVALASYEGGADFEKQLSFFVPAGEYVIDVTAVEGPLWLDPRRRVVAPAEESVLVEPYVGPVAELGFDVDADAPIRSSVTCLLWVVQGDVLTRILPAMRGATLAVDEFEDVPLELPLLWAVRGRGYRLDVGTERDLTKTKDGLRRTSTLEAGWGKILEFYREDGETPLSGVEVLADGESLGESDRHGLFFLDLPRMPKALSFNLEGWEVVWGRVDPSEPKSFGLSPTTPVHMARKYRQMPRSSCHRGLEFPVCCGEQIVVLRELRQLPTPWTTA